MPGPVSRNARRISLVALLAALVKPPVAGLVLRVVAVGLAAIVAVLAVRLVVGKLDPADGIGRKPDPRAPGELPRELASLTEELRSTQRRDSLPHRTLYVLRSSIQHRLWQHRRLSSTSPNDDPAIRAGRITVFELCIFLRRNLCAWACGIKQAGAKANP